HVLRREPLHRSEIRRAAVDGSPILVSTVVPAIVLLLGRLDVLSDATARVVAIAAAIVQLLLIGALVARVAPARRAASWQVAAAAVGVGVIVVGLSVLLGH